MQKIRNIVELRLIANEQVEEKKFWYKILMNSKLDLNLNNQNKKNENIENTKSKLVFELSDDLINKIGKISAKSDSRLFVLLVSNLALLLYKYNSYIKQSRFILGSPILVQDSSVKLMNTYIILDCPIVEKNTFRDLLNSIKSIVQQAFKHQNYPFDILKDELSQYFQCEINRLFNVGILLDSIQRNEYLMDVDYDLLFIFENSDKLRLVIEYDKNIYNEEGIILYKKHYMSLLDNALSNMNDELSDIHIINKEEKQSLLYEFNNNDMKFPANKLVHQLFEDQVEKTPDKIAIVFENKFLTYSALNKKSNQLGRYIRKLGVTSETIVPVISGRKMEMIIAVIAVMKSGSAYLPVDINYLHNKIEILKNNINPMNIILSLGDKENIDKYNLNTINISDLDLLSTDASNLDKINTENNLTYSIFTSGSTGLPKVVCVEHKQLVNIAFGWYHKYNMKDNTDNILQLASFSFDVFIGDLTRSILFGNKLVLSTENVLYDFENFGAMLLNQKITMFESTPMLIIPIMNYIYEKAISLKYLRLLIIGSDTLKSYDYNNLVEKIGEKTKIINSYGVTEATIDSSFFDISNCDDRKNLINVPIGKPLPNIKYYILDYNLNLNPIGVIGELFIGGAGVARGYFDRDDLTREKFISNPFDEGRLYRTGDLARWLPDGNIEFLGRIDHQVKIRGFRIELGEIESLLLKHENIKESVVLAREENGDKYLCAYMVCKEEFSHEELRAYLSAQLPDYMIPSYFVEMESLPLNGNGKVNRKALPSPEVKAGDDYVAPSNKTEEQLVKIWSEVLNIPQEEISVTANFFSIGGNSLKVMRLHNIINQNFDVQLNIVDYFNHNYIKVFADLIISLLRQNEDDMNTINNENDKHNILKF